MKNSINILTIVCLFLFSSLNVEAQSPMVEGTNNIMVGIGIGGYGGSVSSSVSPTISATFQRGIKDDVGPGNISVGGTVAFKSGKFDGFISDYRWNYFAVAARASYHPHFVKSEKFDLYAGLGFGYYNVSTSTRVSDADVGSVSASTVAFTYHLGARYLINEKFSAWAELGNQLSLISAGAAYTF